MKHLLFITSLLIFSCGRNNSSTTSDSTEMIDTTEISNHKKEVVEKEKEEMPLSLLLSKLLVEHQFDEAKIFIKNHKIDVNDFIEIPRGRTYVQGRRILPEMTRLHCDSEITEFLLAQGSNPNLPSVTVSVPEWEEAIPENLDIRKDDLSIYRNQGMDITEGFPLNSSLGCKDSSSFYLLINAGANQYNSILNGSIKWSDTVLIKKMVAKEISVNFVPNTNNVELLKLLIPITDGEKYGEVESSLEGEALETDLMNACRAGNKELVWFMLETGASPNECIPYYFGKDENGYLPAITALSIATGKYEKTEAQSYFEIVELLKKHGAEKIEKCLNTY